ncbi:Uncharacterised protein [Burkholderia pseudomallei]|nr:Uncharacterised protein [Burkholderia pseudomallei]VBI14557.1 Uncharacterised protein [Burkholderia pseudomallei]VBJ50600.1 Uncharacterised protein [Burkholderia pseudomallei]VBO63819.1 Uncharacterised protein [Burkholderia pseudomallei]VBO97999.1 Uncharacterised protein [Burkholderia pseudomallei]
MTASSGRPFLFQIGQAGKAGTPSAKPRAGSQTGRLHAWSAHEERDVKRSPRIGAAAARNRCATGNPTMKEKPRGSRRKRCGESRGALIRAGRRRASAPGALRRSRRVAGARIGATTGRRTRPYRSSAASGPFCSTDEFTPRVFRERNPPADGQRLRCPPRACRRMLGRKADIAHAPKFAYCESRSSGLRRPNRRADRLRMRARRAGDRGHAPHHA